MRKRHFSLLLISLCFLSFLQQPPAARSTKEYIPSSSVAGQALQLHFSGISEESRLLLQNSYGSTILKPQITAGTYHFQVPEFMSRKMGILSWKLRNAYSERSGNILIQAAENTRLIESYFGPRSLEAGTGDHAMLVALPTDDFDNIQVQVPLSSEEFFKDQSKESSLKQQNQLQWKLVTARKKTGKVYLAAKNESVQTGELVAEIYPARPVDFSVEILPPHPYADGNSVSRLRTSILKDAFGNKVSDGTAVTFIMREPTGAMLKTTGNSVDGYATAEILHPEIPGKYQIQAFVEEMAKSGVIDFEFRPALKDFSVQKLEKRQFQAGPLRSFLGQLVSDGVTVEVRDSRNQFILKAQTKDGFATFELPPAHASQSQTIKISVLGKTQIQQNPYYEKTK